MRAGTPGARVRRALHQYYPLYIMLIPGILWYALFCYGPMYGVQIAFKNFNIAKGIIGSPWADPWYHNYEKFFNSIYCSRVIVNTLVISFLKILFGVWLPVLLAVLLNECRVSWFKRVIQTFTYMPHFLSWVIIYGILISLFSQSTGLINRYIRDLTGNTIPFLTDVRYFRTVVVSSDVWQNAGWGAIVYLAAIAGIDPTLYEAAIIDGCGRFKCILHITLPHLGGVFMMLFILRLGSILNAGFDQMYILTNTSTLQVGEIIDTWVFKAGLEQMEFSLASAVGLLKSAIGMTLVLTTNRLARKWGNNIW